MLAFVVATDKLQRSLCWLSKRCFDTLVISKWHSESYELDKAAYDLVVTRI